MSALHLVGLSVLLGFGHMFCMAGHQMLMVRAGGPLSRENVLGYYMIAAAIGQGAGPLMVGWLGGSASLPPTELLFAISLGIAAVGLVVALMIRPARASARLARTTPSFRSAHCCTSAACRRSSSPAS